MTIRIDLPEAVRRAGRRGWSRGYIRRLQLALDGTAVVLGVAILFQFGIPDLVVHSLWVVMAVQGFLFGLKFALLRIALVSFVLFAYTAIAQPSPALAIELVKSQVMTIVAIIVAVMADRLGSTSSRYAGLYREASDRLLTAQEDERLRLSREVHDGVGQTLTALTLTLDAAQSMLNGEKDASPLARSALRRAQELAAIAMGETRDVASRLRPARFAEAGLGAEIQELAEAAGVTVDVHIEPDLVHPGLLAPDAEMEIYRIVQEALGNAARYASATRIWIDMAASNGNLQVIVGDDGIGFDPYRIGERGLGLAGMTERALLLRADLEIRSAVGAGTTIALTVPLPPAATAAHRPAAGPRLTRTGTVAAR
ncbi:MAG: sensor histidine kinase [Chloroflexota bacterium]|nr:sensor histidine kinase [Chloroflexota bacterium]